MKRLCLLSLASIGLVLVGWWVMGLNRTLPDSSKSIKRADSLNPPDSNVMANLNSPFESRQSSAVEPETEPGSEPLFNQRVFPNGSVDLEAVNLARSRMQQVQLRPGSAVNPVWVQRGPNNIQGRVTSIAVDPTNDDIAYVGAAEGGVFRTVDGGGTWTALFDDKPSLSMGAVTIDPSNPNTVFAGTGEVNPGRGSVAYGGTGLYRSDDRGNSWTFIGLENSGSIGRIAVHPTNPDLIHVAVMGHLWSPSADRGVYRTEDGGLTWSRVLYVDDTTGCVDIIQRPDDPDILFASMWTRIRGPEAWDYGGMGCAVYRSDDAGLTWSLAGNGLPQPSVDGGRIGLAICMSNPDVMCAIYSDGTGGQFTGLYRTTDGGDNWTQTNDGSLANSFRSAGWWYGNVRIHPADENIIYVVGFDDYVSVDGGSSYNIVAPNMHVDHHALGFGAGVSAKIYAGNDGGVYTSTDGVTFVKTTGDFPITQTYRVATAAWNTSALWLGTQDNGTSQDLDGDGDFDHIFGGDGFEPLPHLTDSNRLWVQYQFGNVFYSSDAGGGFSNAGSGLSGRTNWNAPHAADPGDPETRYFGTHKLFRNDGNTSWTAISGDLTGGAHQGNGGQVDGTLTTIGVSPVDSQVIWTGSDDGVVHVTLDGGTNWNNVSAGLPQRWVTSVRPHPVSANTALVTLSGFRWGEDVAHIYRTENSGQTWTPVDGGLPDIPVNDVLFDPENTCRYFAATDVGVFQTMDSGESWNVFGSGLPIVVVNDLAYQDSTREVFAGTYGRSIFSITIPEVVADTITVVTGDLTNGSVEDLVKSDDVDVSVRRGNSVQSVVEIQLKGISHLELPGQLTFTFEASVFARGNVTQTISLFDYDSDAYEQVDVRLAGRFSDQKIEAQTTGNASRFVQPGTGCVEARIRFTGITPRLQFTSHIDQAFWSVTQ